MVINWNDEYVDDDTGRVVVYLHILGGGVVLVVVLAVVVVVVTLSPRHDTPASSEWSLAQSCIPQPE